jgi:glyoxylase-like metal-dependent hydrolase (beta-lactamase superfamily II)
MLQRQLGNIRIHRIIEWDEPNFDPLAFFPQTTREDWEPHKQWLDPVTGYITLPMQSYLVRTRHHTILVDTCIGDHKKRQGGIIPPNWHMTTGGILLKNLAAAGVQPEDVDYVMCTHLHTDHVGWNTRMVNGRWIPTFPNARYIMSRLELEGWLAIHEKDPREHLMDSVLPVVEAGQAELVTNDYALDDEVWLEPTPGHTPDHVSVRLASNGSNAIITGDMIHSPVQCMELDWVPRPDFDPILAGQTRRAFLERYCDTDTLICATHFPSPSFGHIVPHGDVFQFAYENSADA